MRTALVVLILAAMAAVLIVSHCASEDGDASKAAAREVGAVEPVASAPRPGAPKSLEQLFLDAMEIKGYTLDGPEPPAAAMRDALATALTVWMPGATFDTKRTTLTVTVTDGSGCDADVLYGLAAVGANLFPRIGFTRIKCEPEGVAIAIK